MSGKQLFIAGSTPTSNDLIARPQITNRSRSGQPRRRDNRLQLAVETSIPNGTATDPPQRLGVARLDVEQFVERRDLYEHQDHE